MGIFRKTLWPWQSHQGHLNITQLILILASILFHCSILTQNLNLRAKWSHSVNAFNNKNFTAYCRNPQSTTILDDSFCRYRLPKQNGRLAGMFSFPSQIPVKWGKLDTDLLQEISNKWLPFVGHNEFQHKSAIFGKGRTPCPI